MAMRGATRSLELARTDEKLRPDQEAERTRQAIIRKNQGTAVFGS